MALRDRLEGYNTGNIKDDKMLDTIYSNVQTYCSPGSTNTYKIKKIIEAFNNFDCIMIRFEQENENILNNIKRYIMGCKLDSLTSRIIEDRMKEWGLFFDGIGIEPSFIEQLVTRYRNDFIVKYSKQEKKQIKPIIYLEYLFIVRKLSSATKAEQTKTLEELMAKNENLFYIFSEYLTTLFNENVLLNRFISISDSYLEKLMCEEFFLTTIKEIVARFLKKDKYIDYEQDIKRLYFIQYEYNSWIDINKLNNFILEKKLTLLKQAHLIEEVYKEDKHLIKLTEAGISFATNQLFKIWESDKYVYESENEVFIPFDSNPLLLSKYLFNKIFDIKESDFLVIFEHKSQVT